MKKLLVLILLVTASSAVMAQQGSWYLGGLVGISSSTDEPSGSGLKTKNSSWAFAPEFGTFLKDDIQLGVALGITGSKSTFDGNDVSKSFELDPTIYGRKFFKIDDNFKVFAGLYLSLISEKTTDYNPTVESKTSGFGAKLGAGIAYSLSSRFTAVGQYGVLGFESTKDKVDGTETGKSSSFNFGVNTIGSSVFNIGLYYTIKQ